MRDMRIRVIAEIGLAVALFAVLELLALSLSAFWPAGGSISLSMLPIVLIALMRGPVVGIICGVLAGILDAALLPGTYIVTPIQALLDYPVAYGLVGLAGLFKPGLFSRNGTTSNTAIAAKSNTTKIVILAVLGALVGSSARFIAHFASGVIFFGMYAPDFQHPAVFSALYNIGYMGPSALATMVAAAIIYPILRKALNLDADLEAAAE